MVRELADVAGDVRAVPPPPLPVLPGPYSMRFVDPDADAEMISEWMNRPHLANTWHYDRPADQWHDHLSIQFDGTFSRPYVVSLDGQAFGYIELFRAARDDLATVYEADPYDVGLHGAIADPATVEKGHGQFVMPHMFASVFSADPQCRRVVGDTPVDSDAQGRRFWERIGGAFLGEPYIPKWNRQTAIFAWLRSPEDIPRLRGAPRQ